MKIVTTIENFDEPLYLESGRILESFKLAYETYGELNKDKSNAIVVFHALTGSHHAAGNYEGDKKAGWWNPLIGDEKTVDTKKYFVICVNVLGSCFGSTGPMSNGDKDPLRLKFPVITISDMVKSQMKLFERLGIKKAHAIIGGSMGGMQALCCAVEYPAFTDRVICLASTYATQAWAIAFNRLAMEGIVNDPRFKDGHYGENDFKEEGLFGFAVGRMAGHISFLSPHSMDKKFGRNYVETDGLYELFGRFQVERYMEYNGHSFAKRFDPLSYLYIIKAMNIFDATRNYDSLEDSLHHIKAKMTLIAFKEDKLFRPREMEEIRDTLVNVGRGEQVDYVCIDSDYGHDAFLIEYDKFDFYIEKALK
ncbi:homoserine O-acetyltransferase MetX [Sulfurospirillum arcachonense]|uniref:homoserine O-acetyltransferase MetX n=1 Tax=Sulfurospirillum arcachonense TaxID=57666 RepID=UPI00046A9AA8|nr:homoserine O-acetyltransferase [Sulfurospirillum arcachonense]